jgi:hypothetical protein
MFTITLHPGLLAKRFEVASRVEQLKLPLDLWHPCYRLPRVRNWFMGIAMMDHDCRHMYVYIYTHM